MDYDADGRVTATISPTGGTTLQSYDADGNLTATIAADDSSIVQSYDAAGRETQAIWYDPGHSVVDTQNKTYDNDGDLLTASNVNGTYAFSYDPDNRATQVSEPFGQTLGYAYDGNGNQTQTVDSFGGTQTSIYDVQGRLTTREYSGEGQTLRVDFVYTAEGQIATQTDYDSLSGPGSPSADLVSVTDNSFDADNNVTAVLSTDASTATIDQFVYTLDQAGNISSEVDTQGGTPTTTSYSYDHANQLTAAGGSNYSYDSSGNRDSPGYTTTLGNEMTSDGTYNYTYDAKGNELTKTDIATGDKWTYGYNNANEMTSAVEETSGSVVEQSIAYSYDVFGNLIQESVTISSVTTTTRFVVDGWNPNMPAPTGNENFNIWAVLDGSSSLKSRYVYGDGVAQPLARVDVSISNTTYWELTDHLGSVRSVISNSGTVADSIAYDAYGHIAETNAGERGIDGFTASFTDMFTGFQLHSVRWLDPGTGRWMQQDPTGFAAGDADLYRYVGNNPTNLTDPSGLLVFDDPWQTLAERPISFVSPATMISNTNALIARQVFGTREQSNITAFAEFTAGSFSSTDVMAMAGNTAYNFLSAPWWASYEAYQAGTNAPAGEGLGAAWSAYVVGFARRMPFVSMVHGGVNDYVAASTRGDSTGSALLQALGRNFPGVAGVWRIVEGVYGAELGGANAGRRLTPEEQGEHIGGGAFDLVMTFFGVRAGVRGMRARAARAGAAAEAAAVEAAAVEAQAAVAEAGGAGAAAIVAPEAAEGAAPTTPQPGRMHIETYELTTGQTGRDFVIPGRSVPEIFSARLPSGSTSLRVAWTESLSQGRVLDRLAQVQELAGGPGRITQITGQASDGFQTLIGSGQFNAQQAAQALGQRLGGRWRVDVTPAPNSTPPTWDITAVRLGD